jgi:hypothetical protein
MLGYGWYPINFLIAKIFRLDLKMVILTRKVWVTIISVYISIPSGESGRQNIKRERIGSHRRLTRNNGWTVVLNGEEHVFSDEDDGLNQTDDFSKFPSPHLVDDSSTKGPSPHLASPTTAAPSISPSKIETMIPNAYSTIPPSNRQSTNPTNVTSGSPSKSPTSHPTIFPSKMPTNTPTSVISPSKSPTFHPTISPSNMPTSTPTNFITISPSKIPTSHPTILPSNMPTTSHISPTRSPRNSPSNQPTTRPSRNPTSATNSAPSKSPSEILFVPSSAPSTSPAEKAENVITLDDAEKKKTKAPRDDIKHGTKAIRRKTRKLSKRKSRHYLGED